MRKPTIYFAAVPQASLLLSLVKKKPCPLISPERGHFVLTNHSKSKQEYFDDLKAKNLGCDHRLFPFKTNETFKSRKCTKIRYIQLCQTFYEIEVKKTISVQFH